MFLKHLNINRHGLCAFFIILFAIVLRIILIVQGWPATDSDEGTLGLMARHIAYRGEYPIFFYGQGYMGSFEAYLGAILFHLRSEEHTSELQSRFDLVCRLLLEKKKK